MKKELPKSVEFVDVAALINMKAPSVHQIYQPRTDQTRQPLEKLLTENQLSEFNKLLGKMRCANHTETSRYLGKKSRL